jgi:Flp pilus assembly pilin Flp
VHLGQDNRCLSGLGRQGYSSFENENFNREGPLVTYKLSRLLTDEEGQDIAEYAVMLAVILVLVVGTIRLVGSNANNAFSQAASSIQ